MSSHQQQILENMLHQPSSLYGSTSPHSMSDRTSLNETIDVSCAQATGRKSYKMCTNGKEPVWPPELESALISALEAYANTGPRVSKRHPKRNRYISDYIYQCTRVKRTPKQVGSRIQQLKETCLNSRILRLIDARSDEAYPPFFGQHTPPSPSDSNFSQDNESEVEYDAVPNLYNSTSIGPSSSGLTTMPNSQTYNYWTNVPAYSHPVYDSQSGLHYHYPTYNHGGGAYMKVEEDYAMQLRGLIG